MSEHNMVIGLKKVRVISALFLNRNIRRLSSQSLTSCCMKDNNRAHLVDVPPPVA